MQIKKSLIHFILYFIVGCLATIVEWGAFYVFDNWLSFHYILATALAFVLSTFANWAFGRLILFRESKQNTWLELAKIYAVSIIGLLLNIGIMYIEVEKLLMNEMLSKMIATGIVFVWNFLIRKFVIYKI
ncbi:MAG: GtrA family protein [Treponema sp.]|jgi:putative flippase GtrA|nr:GtrA family protein [Treponema sp.]